MSEASTSEAVAVGTRRCRLRKYAWLTVATVVVFGIALLLAPHFIDLALFKSTYLPGLEEAMNRRLDVGEVRLSLVPRPSIRLAGFTIFERAPSSDKIFFSAQQVHLRLRVWPLLQGRFEASELVIDRPVVNLVKHPVNFSAVESGDKKAAPGNRSEFKKRSPSRKPSDSPPTAIIIPGNLKLRDGQINVVSADRVPVSIRGIDLALQNYSAETPFPFRAAFSYPGLKTISLSGELDYREDKAFLKFTRAELKIHDLALPLEGSISHLATTPEFEVRTAGSDVDAKPIFQILSVFGLAPRDTEVSGAMDVQMSITGPANDLVTEVRGVFKDVRVHGKRALNGSLSGDAVVRLPIGAGSVSKRLQGNGKLVARDGALTNVNLIKKIERVTGLIGLSKDQQRQATTFKKMEADFILSAGYADFKRLYIINPQIEVTGDGTMTIEQPTLNIALRTALSQQASSRVGRGRLSSFLKDGNGRIVVPLKVIGPVENPVVDVNTRKLAETGLPPGAEKGFSSFFQRLFRAR